MKKNLLMQSEFKGGKIVNLYLFGLLLFLFSFVNGYSQSISAINVSPTTVCAGTTVTLTFTATSANGTVRQFTNATVFEPYLSAVGGGAPYSALPTFTEASLPATGTNGASYPGLTTTITIPVSTTPGTTYKISLGCSNNPTLAGNTGTYQSANFTVVAPAVGGTVSGSATKCSGTNSTTLTLSGHTGSVSKWQYSSVSDFSSGVVDVANTTTSLTATNLTATRYYRAVLVSGSCTANSSVATITVNPLPAGTLTNGGTVCAGTQPQLTFTASAGTGPFNLVINGQTYNSISSGVAFTATGTAPTSNTTYTLTSITGTLCSNSAPAASTNVTVNPASVGGTVSGGTAVCAGTNSTTLTLSGHVGAVTKWQSSPVSDFSSGVVDIANTTTTLTATNLSSSMYYRAVVTSGICPSANSSIAGVTAELTTWNGSAWSNGTPSSAKAIVFTGNYTATGSFAGCRLNVTNNAVVTIPSGFSVTIDGAITVDAGASLIFENNANLLQNGTTNSNSGNIVLKRNSSALKRLDYTLWSSPVSGQQLQSFSPQTLSNRFYTYNTTTNLYDAVATPSATNFATATGYLIRTPNNHPTTATNWEGVFTGVPNNGNITYTMANIGVNQRFNLVGNPYPSPINANAFISANSANITGTLYFWRKTNNAANPSYCVWTDAGFVSNGEDQVFNPNDVIRTGQGFFVEAINSSTTLNFTNSMRVDDTANQFFRVANQIERNRIWLNATGSGGLFSQTMVTYMTGATNGFDTGIDGRYINDGQIALTSLINNEKYAIQGRALPFVNTDVVPLNFTASADGNYSIAIDQVDGLFTNPSQNIYIKDNANNITHNLRNSAYNFSATAGSDSSRFELVFIGTVSTYYQDLDSDGFGNSAVSIESDSQPLGYVLVGGDCDDNNPNANPGMAEVLYNGIDDNCDGNLDEGFQIVSNMICNPNLGYINSKIYCQNIANVSGYRFEITNTSTNDVYSLDKTVNYFNLTEVPNFAYTTTYNVRVMLQKNGTWLGYFGAPCSYTTPAIPLNSIVSTQCGASLSELNGRIFVSTVFGTVNYRYRVALSSAPTTYEYVTTQYPSFRLSALTTLPLNYDNTYLIAVQSDVLVNGSMVTSAYGNECIIRLPSLNTVSVSTNLCGSTLEALNSRIFVNSVPNANQYTYRVALASNPSEYNDIVSQYTSFRLSALTTVPLLYNETYNVSVSVRVNINGVNTDSPFGPVCQYTTPSAPGTIARNLETPFSAVGYPNPFSTNFTLNVKSSSTSTVNVTVYDMLGRMVEQRDVKVNEVETTTIGDNLPIGVYNVIVAQDKDVNTIRMIKR